MKIGIEPISKRPKQLCGPVCLSMVLKNHGKNYIKSINKQLEWPTDLAYELKMNEINATVFTHSKMFSPDWFSKKGKLIEKLRKKINYNINPKAKEGYKSILTFLEGGGNLRFQKLNKYDLEKKLKKRSLIILSVKSNNFRNKKVHVGHFLVLKGFNLLNYIVLSPKKHKVEEVEIEKSKLLDSFYNWGSWCLEIKK